MGTAWWAIGQSSFSTYIVNMNADLFLPEPPKDFGRSVAINAAMENTVSEKINLVV